MLSISLPEISKQPYTLTQPYPSNKQRNIEFDRPALQATKQEHFPQTLRPNPILNKKFT